MRDIPRLHGGNVHEKGIVRITSKSVLDGYDLENLVNLTDWCFFSKDEPGQWVCWDFGDMRVRPTRYTIEAYKLATWVVEGSSDGDSWTVIDRQTDSQNFKAGRTRASFAVWKLVNCRFIRLTQTRRNHSASDQLILRFVDFFGTLYE
jgi:hypothetical protein